MKRLTERIQTVVCYVGQHRQHSEDIPAEVNTPGVQEILERLAEYEDNIFSPETEAAIIKEWKDWADAKNDGRMVILPCKIGTAVYRMDFNQHDGEWLEPHFFRLQDLEHVGKTIFITLEEAEAALKGVANAD